MTPAGPPRTRLSLLTIIGEAVLEDRLLRDLREFGVRGWTLDPVRGEGSRGTRASTIEGGNLRIETLVTAELADRILDHVAEQYFPHFAVIAFTHPVDVVRGEKFR